MEFNIFTGKISKAQKCLIYGVEGVGKSTLAAQFPDPLFIDTEGSTKHLDVRRIDTPKSWQMLFQEVQWLLNTATTTSAYKTLVIDTIDWAERLCIQEVCNKRNKQSIEDFGYGAGYTYVYEEFGKLLNLLSDVSELGIHVVLVGHAIIRKFELPNENAGYDRYQLKLIDTPKKSIANMVKEWADCVLFANYKTIVETVGEGKMAKGKARGNKRVLYCNHHACWDAKNRWELPDEIPLEYDQIAPHLTPQGTTEATLTKTNGVKEIPAASSQSPQLALPDFWEPAAQLMQADGVTLDEIRKVAADHGHFPLETPPENFDPAYVSGFIVPNWSEILAVVKANRVDVPFD